MGISKNTLLLSDISSIPIKLGYSASYNSSSLLSYGITLNKGVNAPYSISSSFSLNYILAKQLYYNESITGSIYKSSSYWNDSLQSTAASGTFDSDNRIFPTGSNNQITLIAIPRTIFGENISRKSFSITSSTFNLMDDGNGNIIDSRNSNRHSGNILYSQGIIVITNQNYTSSIYSPFTMSLKAESTIYQNEVRCKVNENDFNYTLNPSANKLGTTGSYIDAVTGSEFRPYATTIGLYNDKDELLIVGKLSRPYPIPQNTDMTFVIRWDT